jgi:hypothetical protein
MRLSFRETHSRLFWFAGRCHCFVTTLSAKPLRLALLDKSAAIALVAALRAQVSARCAQTEIPEGTCRAWFQPMDV